MPETNEQLAARVAELESHVHDLRVSLAGVLLMWQQTPNDKAVLDSLWVEASEIIKRTKGRP